MQQINVSVLMPSLNAGPFLSEAVTSVLQQQECMELLVADGGSDDGSLHELEVLASKDSRLRIVSRSDKGPADGLNKALAHAKGDWIGWLNADDTYQPGALQRAIGTIRKNPGVEMVYGHGQHIDSEGNFVEIYPSRFPEIGIEGFKNHCFICQPTVLINKNLLGQVGNFNPQYKYAFDLELWLRIFKHAPGKIMFVDALQASTRLHEGTITSKRQYQINLECAQLVKQSFGNADEHWITTAAAAYVDLNRHCKDYKRENIEETLLTDPEIETNFATSCESLFREQKTENCDNFVRSELPDELRSLLQSRPDLLNLEFHKVENERLFNQWLISNGFKEYKELLSASKSLSKLADWLLSPGDTKGMSRLAQAIWDNHPEHQVKWNGKNKAKAYKAWLRKNWDTLDLQLPTYEQIFKYRKRRKVWEYATRLMMPSLQNKNGSQGINLIGYTTYALGIGEDVRTCFHALTAAGVDTKIIDFKPGDGLFGRRELSLEDEVMHARNKPDYEVSLICLTAEETTRWAITAENSTKGPRKYIIGYWPWELPNWPKNMLHALSIVDEIWVSTNYIAKGLECQTKKPIKVMPLCAETPDFPAKPLNAVERRDARDLYQLPQESTLFCFAFDLSSYINRKNPWACIKAFHQAFPPQMANGDRNDVGLIIKTYPPKSSNRDWEQLKELCSLDSRIHLMETNLTRYQLLQLYGCCDGFLSLHRAEGFGRGMAEALQLGLDVVATDWSGNTDFCKGPLAHPIPYELVPVTPGAYPHWPGQFWAEPNIKAAAEALRKIDSRRKTKGLPTIEISTSYRQQFSASSCGARYRERLEELGFINET